MKNRPFSIVFLGVIAAAVLVQFGREVHSILSLPAEDREGPFWHFREGVMLQIVPYALLGALVPFVRLPAASRWFLIFGFLIVGGIGVFDLGRLNLGGGEVGLAAFLCLRMQIWTATAAALLALVIKAVQHSCAKNEARS